MNSRLLEAPSEVLSPFEAILGGGVAHPRPGFGEVRAHRARPALVGPGSRR